MTIRTVELSGKRYVILPEREFLKLQGKFSDAQATKAASDPKKAKFREVTPLKVGGIPASELLIRDRQ